MLYSALDKVEENKNKVGQTSLGLNTISGGIAPHHDAASELSADFFYQLSLKAKPKTFIILGPVHSDVALAPGITGRVAWQTPFGAVENDYQILSELVNSGAIAYDEENYTAEHSVRVLAPFIKYYFPDAKIAPIILTSKYGFNESLALAERLAEYLKQPDTVIIASLDFSHYLPSSETPEKDAVTLQAIEDKNYQFIAGLNSDYIDSPLSLIILLRALELAGADEMQVLQHADLSRFVGREVERSTSYFTIAWGKE